MTLRRRNFLIEECPVRTKLYGGIPGGGGYGSHRELEVGAQAMAEAVHCILGSLGKIARTERGNETGPQVMAHYLRYEQGHLREELNIVKRALGEFSKKLYVDRINDPTEGGFVRDREGAERSTRAMIRSIRETSPALRDRARTMAKQLVKHREGLPRNVVNAALSSYAVLLRLAIAMEDATKPWPDPISNPFKDSKLRRAITELDKHVGLLLRGELGPIDR